jgi:3-hydroxyanthranilate 3,4-dioxygenase
MLSVLKTIDVQRWVRERKELGDRPYMSHDRIWNDGFLVLLFDGPTPPERMDFHINTSPEFFYQLVGDMHCRVLEDGVFRDFVVAEGEMFLLPARIPHRNSRDRGSLGIVVHQARDPGALDAIVWYCEKCQNVLHRVDYQLSSLREQLQEHIRNFLGSEALRTCKRCGTVMSAERGFM